MRNNIIWGIGVGLMMVASQAMALKVVATIPPLASMVAPVLPANADLTVILKPGGEAHGYRLKPSDIMALEQADVILSMGMAVDRWANKAIIRSNKPVIRLAQLEGVIKRPFRHGKVKVVQNHHAGHHRGHHSHHHEHDQERIFLDPHAWLLPHNAGLMVQAFTTFLSTQMHLEQEPEAWLTRLKQLDLDLKKQLQPMQGVPFVVLHDAFQYFELAYGLEHAGTIQLSESLRPSVKHIMQLQQKMREKQVQCVVKEPQFPSRQVDYVIRGLSEQVQVVSIDPLGGRDGKLLPYDQFLQTIADGFSQCLMSN